MYIYGHGSINGSGSFRDDPDVWNDHFRKMSFPHVWNGVPGNHDNHFIYDLN